MTFLSIAAAFAFTLVVATITANPVHNKEKLMLNLDPVMAIEYFWNEEIGKDQSAQDINPWNDIEEDQKKSFYTMRDDGEGRDKGKDGDSNPWNNIEEDQKKNLRNDGEDGDKGKDGDRDQNGDKGKDGDSNQNGNNGIEIKIETKKKIEIEMEIKIRGLSNQSNRCTGVRKRSTTKPGLRLKLKDQVGIYYYRYIYGYNNSCMLVFFFHPMCIQTAGPSLAARGSD